MFFAFLAGCLLAAYLVGSIPFGFLTGRLVAGVDIRTVGSGNIGATNVGRVIGWHWFFVVLVLDFLKGFAPAFAAPQLLQITSSAPPAWLHADGLIVLAGTAAILGHLWPIWLRFKGGKGVATGLGVISAVATIAGPWPLAAAAGVFFTAVLLTRYISLGSILGAVAYGACQLYVLSEPLSAQALVAAFSILVPALVIWRHRTNIGRLWRGEEAKVLQKAESREIESSPSA